MTDFSHISVTIYNTSLEYVHISIPLTFKTIMHVIFLYVYRIKSGANYMPLFVHIAPGKYSLKRNVRNNSQFAGCRVRFMLWVKALHAVF